MCDDRLVDDQMMRWRDDPRNFVYAQMIGVITGGGRIGFDLCREDKWNCVTAPHTKSKKDEYENMHMWSMVDGKSAKRSMDCVKSVLEVSFVWVWNAFIYVKKCSKWIRKIWASIWGSKFSEPQEKHGACICCASIWVSKFVPQNLSTYMFKFMFNLGFATRFWSGSQGQAQV